MGYMRHHAIVCTGMLEYIDNAHKKALDIFGFDGVSPLGHERVNGYQSFCVWPDGSKEGWDESKDGDSRRGEFVWWLENKHCEETAYQEEPLKTCLINWVEVRFGDDNCVNSVIGDSESGFRDIDKEYTSEEARRYKERCEELEKRLHHESRLRRRAEESRPR